MSTATASPSKRASARRSAWVANFAKQGLAAWTVVLIILLGLTITDGARFWGAANLATVLTAMVVLGLVSLGQHLVVLSGGIDLSVGSAATLSALLTAVLINGYPIRTAPVVLGMLAMGAVIGVIHGLLVGRAGLPPFIVTLGSFYVLQGLAFLVSTKPTGQVTSALSAIGLQRIGPLPYSIAVLIVATVAVAVLLRRTVYGRHLFATGGDPEAAYASGLPVTRIIVMTYVFAGVLAALAGIILAARATIGSPTAGQGLELSAITVVVIGGTSLLGGRGSLTGTLGGVALLALITSSVTFLQLPSTWTDLVRGLVILVAAAVFVTRRKV